jgi:hypothetical protein
MERDPIGLLDELLHKAQRPAAAPQYFALARGLVRCVSLQQRACVCHRIGTAAEPPRWQMRVRNGREGACKQQVRHQARGAAGGCQGRSAEPAGACWCATGHAALHTAASHGWFGLGDGRDSAGSGTSDLIDKWVGVELRLGSAPPPPTTPLKTASGMQPSILPRCACLPACLPIFWTLSLAGYALQCPILIPPRM